MLLPPIVLPSLAIINAYDLIANSPEISLLFASFQNLYPVQQLTFQFYNLHPSFDFFLPKVLVSMTWGVYVYTIVHSLGRFEDIFLPQITRAVS